MYYMERLAQIRHAAPDSVTQFTKLAGQATCALHAGEQTPDLSPLIGWLAKCPPIEIDELRVSNHTRDIALFGRTLANHLLELRLEARASKR